VLYGTILSEVSKIGNVRVSIFEKGWLQKMYTHLTIYTDGASRGNPGLAASGIHIVDDTTSETVVDLGFALGIATNNVAEYQAVLHAV